MEYYSTNISNLIEEIIENPINSYYDYDNYNIDIDTNELIKEICKKLNGKLIDNIIIYKNKRIRIFMETIIDNWIYYRYNIYFI